MFSFVVALVSIALVVLLAAATVIYTGDVFGESLGWSDATRLANEAQQISAALELYKVDNQQPAPSLQHLVDGHYLKQIPRGWHARSTYILHAVDVSDDACLAFNQRQQIYSIPSCSDPNYRHMPVCCRG